MLAASSSDILFRNGGYQHTKLTTFRGEEELKGSQRMLSSSGFWSTSPPRTTVWRGLSLSSMGSRETSQSETASVATQTIYRLEHNVEAESDKEQRIYLHEISVDSAQALEAQREVLIYEAAAEFHPSAMVLQGMVRTLEFESHSEAADQREGVEQTQSNLQRSPNASNEGCRKYFHLYEEFPNEKATVVPHVHRLHARERERLLTSEISEAQYRHVSHRQTLEGENARLKSEVQIVKKVWNRSDWSMIQIPKGTRNSLNKCKNWQRKGPSCEKKLYRWEKKRSQRSLWQSQKTKEDQQSWFRDCPFERHHINEKEKKTARINVDLNRSEARVMKTTLLTEGKVQWLLTFFCTNTPLSLKQSRYLMQKRMLTKSGTNWSTCQLGENLKKKVRGRLLSKHERKTVHFATFMDWCHLKKSALEDGFAGYTGRVVLRGDEVKDDSGSHAVVFHVTHDRSPKHRPSFPDCLVALAKRATQYLLAPMWKWRTLQIYWDCQSQNVQLLGYVYHVLDVRNHG